MKTVYKTNRGILIEENDECAESPRDFCENFSKFVTFHRRYSSPDKNEFKDFDDLVATLGKRSIIDTYKNKGAIDGNAELVEYMRKKGYIGLPVYMYDHSGVSYCAAMSNPYPDARWDSGLIGMIYASVEDIAKAYCVKRVGKKTIERVHSCFEAEVKEYSDWANGECYYYTLKDDDGNEIDSCGGFYGSLSENGALDNFGITEYEEL